MHASLGCPAHLEQTLRLPCMLQPCEGLAARQRRHETTQPEHLAAWSQARLPGRDWKERHGTAGVPSDERRGSPIVELSLLLACLHPCTASPQLPGLAACIVLETFVGWQWWTRVG